MNLEEQLKAIFGYNAFRDCQKEIVTSIINQKDVLAILPTGAGKSICYQLPAMVMPGIAVVISPLISLMQDQVISLTKNGIPAAFVNSSVHYSDIRSVMNNLSDYKLLYVAPERLSDQGLIDKLKQANVSFFAIDEAHCISQWGHSFRPEYRQLSFLKTAFPNSSVIALTATATKEVERDIATQLAMKTPHIVRASFDRPNLTFRIELKAPGSSQLIEFLNGHPNVSGIIYAATRKAVDETYEFLQKMGYKVGKYHAGMSDQERSQAQHDFIYGELLLMVATVAFGMGIHKPDIRFIVHVNMPKTIEQYYQEVGRAGRDGLEAECLMLYTTQDLMIYQSFLPSIQDEVVRNLTQKKTNKMYSLCTSYRCRRKDLLDYFDETFSSTNCNRCDNCLKTDNKMDATIIAQKILSCVHYLKQRFGIKYVIDVLRGARLKGILERGHDKLSTYGIMKEQSEVEIRQYIDELIHTGFLKRSDGEYPLLQWTEASRQVTSGKTKVMLRKPTTTHHYAREKQQPEQKAYDLELYKKLSALRTEWAQKTEVPAFVIFGDKTLREMATFFPTSQASMMALNGVGPIKWVRYGQSFLDLIADYCEKNEPVLNQTPPVRIDKPRGLERLKSAEETVRLYMEGNLPLEIAKKRNLASTTIHDHLIEQILLGIDLDISPLVSQEKQEMVKKVIIEQGFQKIGPLKEALPEEFTYEEIRLVASFYQREM